MILNYPIIKKSKNFLTYYKLKYKFYKKYKKIVKYGTYSKIYNPRNEYNTSNTLFKK